MQSQLGQRTGMWNAASGEKWGYDQRGRLIGETKTITGTGVFVSSWQYDSLNRVTWQTYPGGNASQVGEQVNYTYRANGLLQTVVGTNTYVGDTQYDALGNVTVRNLGSATGEVRQRYTYPQAKNYRLDTLTSGVPAGSYSNLQNLTYTYDNAGNVLTIQDTAAYSGTQTQTFTYDALDRLATAAASGQTQYGGYAQQSYGYAANGNLTRFASATDNQAYSDAAHAHAVTHVDGAQKYWYDANGNATKRIAVENSVTSTYEFEYDFENRVTQLKKNGAVASAFKYDGDGNRIVETTGGATTAYLGNTYEWTAGGAKSYYYAGNVRVALRDAAACPQSGVCYLLGDHLGSTTLTTNSSGGKQAELRYYPYGKTRYTYGATPTSFRFTGQRWQANANDLYFYQARWYDPLVGRFLSADTIVPDPKSPQGLNRYTYVGNSPLKYIDPTGHNPIFIAVAAAAGPIGWVALAAGGTVYASYTYGFGPNAESNREGLVNAVTSLSVSWQAQIQNENPVLVGLVQMVEGANSATPAMPNVAAMALDNNGSTDVLQSGTAYAENPWLNAKPGSKKGTKGQSLNGPDFESPDPQKHGRPRKNYDQNAQVDAAIKELGRKYGKEISKDMRSQIHRAMDDLENPGYRDIVKFIESEFKLGGQ